MDEAISSLQYAFNISDHAGSVFDDRVITDDRNYDQSLTQDTLQKLNQYADDLYAGQAYYTKQVAVLDLELRKIRSNTTLVLKSGTKGQLAKNMDISDPRYNKFYTEKEIEATIIANNKYTTLVEKKIEVEYILNRLTNSLQMIRNTCGVIHSFHVDVRYDLKNGVI